MSKKNKTLIITATVFLIAGLIIFISASASVNFDFSKFSTKKYITNTYKISEDFENISIDVNTPEITFVPSVSGECQIKIYDEEKVEYSAAVQNGTLKITANDTRKWYQHIGIYVETPALTVYLPEKNYTLLSVDTNTGDINIPDNYSFESVTVNSDTSDIYCSAKVSENIKISVNTGYVELDDLNTKQIDLSTSTGEIELEDVTCGELLIKTHTGNINLDNVIAEKNITADSSTGNINIKDSDANEIIFQTDTGNVTGCLLSGKEFITDTSTGNVNVPNSTGSGKCEITTGTGNIKISVATDN